MGIFFFAPLLCPCAGFEPSAAFTEAPPKPGMFGAPASRDAADAIAGSAAAASKPPPVADRNFRRSMFESFRALSFKVASAAHSCLNRVNGGIIYGGFTRGEIFHPFSYKWAQTRRGASRGERGGKRLSGSQPARRG